MQDVTKGVTQLSSVLDMGYSSIIHNIDQNVMIYKKKYPFNISTSETPTGTHRVFIPLNIQGKKTIRMSQFPLFEGN